MEPATKPHFLFGKLFLLGIMAIGMIVGSVFWLTYRIDRLEKESSEKLVELMVTERVSQLQEIVTDYSYWDTAYEVVMANDGERVYSELGVSAKPDGIFSHVLILDANRNPLFLYDESGRVDQMDLTPLEPFLTRLRMTSPKDRVTVSGIGALAGGYGAVAAAYVTPTYYDTLQGEPMPILIGVKMFTDEALQAIVQLTQGTGYAVKPLMTPKYGPNVPLIGPNGTPIAELVWTSSKVGTVLRAEIMPGILIVCAGIFGICVSAARYFYRQSAALELAVAVATTDRLTGLLNRAGLDEVLRRPETVATLDWGQMAILYIDLNDFKKMNDIYGHRIGDLALKTLGRRLMDSVRSADHVVRLGGDEFICVICDPDPGAAAMAVSERLLLACSAPLKLPDVEITLSPAMGIAVAGICTTWEALLGQADAAMFQAKRLKQRSALVFAQPNTADNAVRAPISAVG